MATFAFTAPLYLWSARTDSWVFANLPESIADEVEDLAPQPRRGFGAVRVEARLGSTVWRTSVFPSSSEKTFVLPVKKAVLMANGAGPGDTVELEVTVLT